MNWFWASCLDAKGRAHGTFNGVRIDFPVYVGSARRCKLSWQSGANTEAKITGAEQGIDTFSQGAFHLSWHLFLKLVLFKARRGVNALLVLWADCQYQGPSSPSSPSIEGDFRASLGSRSSAGQRSRAKFQCGKLIYPEFWSSAALCLRQVIYNKCMSHIM